MKGQQTIMLSLWKNCWGDELDLLMFLKMYQLCVYLSDKHEISKIIFITFSLNKNTADFFLIITVMELCPLVKWKGKWIYCHFKLFL